LTAPDWESIGQAPEFLVLYRRRRRIQTTLLLLGIGYYFALPVGAGYFPELFRQQVWGPLNVGLLFAISQFVMAAFVALAYARVSARRLDPLAAQVAKKYLPQAQQPDAG
jgi:uncharacterized membrane protein (DUF485 family)